MNHIMSSSSYDDDEVISVGRNTQPFQMPGLGADLLVNKKRVSADVMSLSSHSVSQKSDSDAESERSYRNNGRSYSPNVARVARAPSYSEEESEISGSTEDDDDESEVSVHRPGGGGGGGGGDKFGDRFRAERSRVESELNEKKEILYQMDRLESKGYTLPRKFTIQSDIEEMRAEYHRILREKEIDASVRFQRKMLMAMVTGIEFMNTRFDPFDVKLDGWSEQVHENVTDYDDIFEELHDKYKGSGQKMAPELRLLMSLSGSAFMFHLTNSMFKQTPLPGVEEVMRSNPELMKQFQQAAMNRMGAQQAAQQPQAARGPGGGLFSMVGSMFNMGAGSMGGPQPGMGQQSQMRPQPQMRPPNIDVEDIIEDIHENITSRPSSVINHNRIETMSISDEEITSIIEDAMDTKKTATRKPRKNGARTLNL
jgi:hypothetical protein